MALDGLDPIRSDRRAAQPQQPPLSQCDLASAAQQTADSGKGRPGAARPNRPKAQLAFLIGGPWAVAVLFLLNLCDEAAAWAHGVPLPCPSLTRMHAQFYSTVSHAL
jgi:hypothetical protein